MMALTGKVPPRRILIIVENLPVPFDRRVWNEALTLRQAGYDVSVICPVGSGAASARFDILNDIYIYRYPCPQAKTPVGYIGEYSTALFWVLFLTWRVFLSRGFDAIHACNPPDLLFVVGALFKYLFSKKFVFDHHDLAPEMYEAKFGRRGFIYRMLRALERLTFTVADISIATNESYYSIAVSRGRMSPERVFVVRSGPNLDRVRSVTPKSELKKGRKFLVGYVGVMGEPEGIPYLLGAARHIVYDRGRTDIQFSLVGDGPQLEAMMNLAKQLELNDYVTFTGRVPDEDLLSMLSTADVCVNPDECNEVNDKSTMNKVLEYMALGKPVVQFDMTEGRVSAQEASSYAKCNDATDFANCILELLEDEERRRRMGECGRRRITEKLAWDYEVPKLLAAYSALFDSPRRLPPRGQ